jgi:hypothetical protein
MDLEEIIGMSKRMAAINASLPLTLLTVLDRFADATGMTVSQAIAHLLRQGLRREAEEVKAKKAKG